MAQVNVYRWDDEGAPQIVEGRPSEFINVLKKCLVDGYGTKSAAGWSVAHESSPEETPYIVFQNSDVDGSGGILTIQQGNDNTRNTVRIHGALDFISPSEQGRAGGYFYCTSGGNSSSYANNWVVIATSTAFYIFMFPESRLGYNYMGANAHSLFFAGDIHSFYPNDPASFVTLSGRVNSSQTGWTAQLNYVLGDNPAQELGYVYALDGSESRDNCYFTSGLGLTNLSNSSIQDSAPSIRLLSQLILVTGSYQLSSAGSRGNSEILPFARGRIPGLYTSQENGFRSQSMPFFNEIDGVSYLSIPRPNNGGTNYWINTEEWS